MESSAGPVVGVYITDIKYSYYVHSHRDQEFGYSLNPEPYALEYFIIDNSSHIAQWESSFYMFGQCSRKIPSCYYWKIGASSPLPYRLKKICNCLFGLSSLCWTDAG